MHSKTIRMSIDVPLKDHKRITILATARGTTIREFVIECIYEKIYPENRPNKKTQQAMLDARKGKTSKVKSFDALCKELGI